jgi:hypothetical protein
MTTLAVQGGGADQHNAPISAGASTAADGASTRMLPHKRKPSTSCARSAEHAAEGQLLTTSTSTVASYLEDWYTVNADAWRASTRRGYRHAIDRFLVPVFGSLRLEQLTPQLIQRWLGAAQNGVRGAAADHPRAHHAPIGAVQRRGGCSSSRSTRRR